MRNFEANISLDAIGEDDLMSLIPYARDPVFDYLSRYEDLGLLWAVPFGSPATTCNWDAIPICVEAARIRKLAYYQTPYWRARNKAQQRNRLGAKPRTCPVCRARFTPYFTNQKTCGSVCSRTHRRGQGTALKGKKVPRKLVEFNGRMVSIDELSALSGVDRGTIADRLRRGVTVADALKKGRLRRSDAGCKRKGA